VKYLAAILLLTGCATQRPPKMFTVAAPVKIVVGNSAASFCLPGERIISVPWGMDGKPDFYKLGHELWHLPELGGHFHP